MASYGVVFSKSVERAMIVAIVVFVVVGIVLRLERLLKNKLPEIRVLNKKLSTWFLTLAVLWAVNLFFSQTATPILGNRFWYLLWGIVGLVWLGFIVNYGLVKLPHTKNARKSREEYLKYLPKSK